jgi:Protein of unknown function (DUF669)
VARARASKKMRIDFTGVPEERRQRGRHIPPGEYVGKITSWKKKYKDDDKTNVPYLQWTIQVAEGKHKGVPLYENTSLKKDALFNLRNLIFAATDGKKNVAGRTVDFDPDALLGKKIGLIVEDNEYNNTIRSQIADVRPLSEMEDDDEDEEGDDEEDEDEDDESDQDEEEEEDEETEEEEDEELDEVDVDEI